MAGDCAQLRAVTVSVPHVVAAWLVHTSVCAALQLRHLILLKTFSEAGGLAALIINLGARLGLLVISTLRYGTSVPIL